MVVEREAEEVDLTAVGRVDGHLAVDVLEVEWQPALGGVWIQPLAGLLKVGVFGRQDERSRGTFGSFGFSDGAFQHHLGTEYAGSDFARDTLFVTVAGRNVHDRRDTAAVFGSKTARVDVGVADDVGVEHREEADGVEGIVDHHAVEQHLVLDGRAATDIELSALVTGEDDTRNHLEVLCQVSLSADTRNLGDGLGRHRNHRGLGLRTCLHLVGSDAHRLQGQAGLFQRVLLVQGVSTRQTDRVRQRVIAYAGDVQRVFPVGNARDVEIPVFRGGTSQSCSLQEDVAEHDGLTGGFLVDKSLDVVVLGERHRGDE